MARTWLVAINLILYINYNTKKKKILLFVFLSVSLRKKRWGEKLRSWINISNYKKQQPSVYASLNIIHKKKESRFYGIFFSCYTCSLSIYYYVSPFYNPRRRRVRDAQQSEYKIIQRRSWRYFLYHVSSFLTSRLWHLFENLDVMSVFQNVILLATVLIYNTIIVECVLDFVSRVCRS